MSVSTLVFFGVVVVVVVLWRSGVLGRWQEGKEKKEKARQTEVRHRERADRRRDDLRRAEVNDRRLRVLARSAPSAEQKVRTVGKNEIHTLEVAGASQRRPILLLHGFAGRKEEWGAMIERLATLGCSVVAPDLPGCGESPAIEGGDHDVPAQTRRIRALAEMMNLLPCHLVGAGSGGTIATLWAARNPDSIASLTLIEPFGFRVSHPTELDRRLESGSNPLLPRTKADLPARRDVLFADAPSLDPESEALHEEDLIRRRAHHALAWERSRAEDRTGLLDLLASEIRTPVLYLQGGESKVVHPKTADLVRSLLGDRADVHVLPGCGHLPAVERPEETVSLLLAFLQRIAPSP